MSDVEDVCDRVVIYYGGKIQAMGELKDLLAERDSVRITMPVLPKEKLQKILEIIRADVSEGEVDLDNPTQNLESYFLNIVNEAKESEEETSGATSGSQVAEYLRGDKQARTAADKKLERLSAPASKKKVEAKAKPEVKVDKQKLDKLGTAKPGPKPKKAAAKTAAKKKTDLSAASKKLSGLMGGTKKKD